MTWNKNMDDAPRDGTLLPCPFCGYLPEIMLMSETVGQPEHNTYSYACTNKMCGMQPKTYPCYIQSLPIFKLNWNQRPQPPEVEG